MRKSEAPFETANQIKFLLNKVSDVKLRRKLCIWFNRTVVLVRKREIKDLKDFEQYTFRALKGIDPDLIAQLIAALAPLVLLLIEQKQ